MSTTIPGVQATTTVVSNTPKGNATSVGCFIGGADGGQIQNVYNFSTYTDAVSAFGSTTANGQLIKMISAAFLNGANTVIAVVAAVSGVPSDLAYSQALDLVLKEDNIDYVVIESTSSTAQGYLKTHLQSCLTEYKFRRGYCGMANGTTVAQYVSRAQTLAYDRLFLTGPNYLDNTGVVMSGGVTAATNASLAELDSDPAKPRTGAVAQGVSGVELKMLNSDYDSLHNAGVFTTRAKNGDVGILRYLTSYVGTSNIQEGTIALERDYVANNLTNHLTTQFRQTKLTKKTVAQVQAAIVSDLTDWQKKEIINPDKSIVVNVSQDSTNPSKINADVGYWAIYPLNFIQLNLTLNI